MTEKQVAADVDVEQEEEVEEVVNDFVDNSGFEKVELEKEPDNGYIRGAAGAVVAVAVDDGSDGYDVGAVAVVGGAEELFDIAPAYLRNCYCCCYF
jgi:hypothetical protein